MRDVFPRASSILATGLLESHAQSAEGEAPMSRSGIRLFRLLVLSAALASGIYGQDLALQQHMVDAQQMRAAGHYREAEQNFTEILREARRADPNSVFVAVVLDYLGATQQDLANYAEAERLLTQALSQLKRAGQTSTTNVALVKEHLGETYLEEARYREAEPMLRQSLDILENDEQADPETVAVGMLDVAMVCEHLHKMREAEELLNQSLAILEARRGLDHPILAAVLGPLSSVLMRTGRYDEAVHAAERAWRILGNNPAVGEPDRLNTMGALGTLYSLVGRYAEAETFAKEAVNRAEVIYGPDHPRLAYYLRAYANVLKREDRKTESKAVERRSQAILNHSGQGNPEWHTVNVSALR